VNGQVLYSKDRVKKRFVSVLTEAVLRHLLASVLYPMFISIIIVCVVQNPSSNLNYHVILRQMVKIKHSQVRGCQNGKQGTENKVDQTRERFAQVCRTQFHSLSHDPRSRLTDPHSADCYSLKRNKPQICPVSAVHL